MFLETNDLCHSLSSETRDHRGSVVQIPWAGIGLQCLHCMKPSQITWMCFCWMFSLGQIPLKPYDRGRHSLVRPPYERGRIERDLLSLGCRWHRRGRGMKEDVFFGGLRRWGWAYNYGTTIGGYPLANVASGDVHLCSPLFTRVGS